MIDKRQAADQHPRQIRRQEAHRNDRHRAVVCVVPSACDAQHRQGVAICAVPQHKEDGDKARPPDRRIAERHDCARLAHCRESRAVIPHRLDDQRPLVPRRREVMRRNEVLVILEHRHLRVPNALKRLEVQLHLAVSAQIRNIAQAIDRQRHNYEEDHARRQRRRAVLHKTVRRARKGRIFVPIPFRIDALFI